MKTNLKLTKITISKLDNLNLKPLQKDELQNLKGGNDVLTITNTSTPGGPTSEGNPPSGGGPIDIITGGGNWNDTSSYTSCVFSAAGSCLTRLS